MPGNDEYSTTSDVPTSPRSGWERWTTRAGIALLALIVIAGASGLLGPRKGDTSASDGDYRLFVQYPAITRAG